MSWRSRTAKIRPLAVAMARAGVRPRALRRQRGIVIPFPIERATPARDQALPAPTPPPCDTPLIALSPLRHAPAALAALVCGFALVAAALLAR